MMMPTAAMPPVIKLNEVTKVFVTDEVETHALEQIEIEIARGDYVAISGPIRLRQVDAALDPRPARLPVRRLVCAEWPSGGRAQAVGTRTRP
jgi:hypothetical protein